MYKRRLSYLLAALLLLSALFTSACAPQNVKPFVPLPPPAGAKYALNTQQVVIGDDAQIMSIISPFIEINYKESGAGAGATATEVVEVQGKKGTMLQTKWGDWEKASLQLNEYFGTRQQLVRGLITLEFEEASIIQIFTGRGRYTVDRSYLMLQYEPPETGTWPRLTEASYTEIWGVKRGVLWGATAVWNEGFEDLLPNYMEWGFWETGGYPADVVANALQTVVARRLAGQEPNYELVDEDSARRELIGRQTGFHLYDKGEEVGKVLLEYRNNWGRMPNTDLIGKGPLSKVGWYWKDQYYALVALTPPFSPVGSTLYLFVDDFSAADKLLGYDPVELYPLLRSDRVPNVVLAVHAQGDIGSIRSAVIGGEGGSVDVGDQGGVVFRTLGNPTHDDIRLAANLLAMLGKNGLKGLGLYYAYAPGSGSGLCYYLAAMRLVLANSAEVLNTPETDIGVLDTVGLPDLSYAPFGEQ